MIDNTNSLPTNHALPLGLFLPRLDFAYPQGNRMLIGQDPEQVPVVPAGLFAPGGDAALGCGLPA